ncbi:MAG TPA: Crp/Fnr family transcriptional regulator [Blastocatellia bacterium]|nr:Crp/Fnr family transcriptional regulator [Blastocatellia bacterium]
MATDKIAALRQTSLFGELTDVELKAMADRSVERRLKRGEILFLAGDEAKGLYVIVEGSIRASRVGPDGREQIIHTDRAPATIAEVPVFDDGKYPSTVTAEENTTVLFVSKQDVRRLCFDHPSIGLAALKVLAGRLRKCAELVETLSLREVGQRLARLLLDEATRNGTRSGKSLSMTILLTNQQIAARVGSVREVVSRALARLQQDGLIVIEKHQLSIPDVSALTDYAEADRD